MAKRRLFVGTAEDLFEEDSYSENNNLSNELDDDSDDLLLSALNSVEKKRELNLPMAMTNKLSLWIRWKKNQASSLTMAAMIY